MTLPLPPGFVERLLERIAGRRVVASVSGGKDSAALSLYLRELGIEHDRIFMDTGWEAAETYEHIAYLAGELGPITHLRNEARASGVPLACQWCKGSGQKDLTSDPCHRCLGSGHEPLQMEALVEKKGMFPQRTRRFCTEELKVKPAIEYLNGRVAAGEDVINAVGIRAAESKERANMAEWEWSKDFDCEVWRPLISWSEEDVIAIHKRHGLRPNPLYLKGASRVGCFPCIFARKSEIRFIADKFPEQIVRIRKLEQRVQLAARERHAARGELHLYNPPTFFQAPLRNAEGKRPCMPIDDVVAWSRTARGGRQVELFAPGPGDQGCMRWGLCETAPPDGDEE